MLKTNLQPIFTNIREIGGVGEDNYERLTQLISGDRVVDLLLHLPISAEERVNIASLKTVTIGDIIKIKVTVDRYFGQVHGKLTAKNFLQVRCFNEEGMYIMLTFFNGNSNFFKGKLPIGTTKVVSGKIDEYKGGFQIVHPNILEDKILLSGSREILPIYPLIAGVFQDTVRRLISKAINLLPKQICEWSDESIINKFEFPSLYDAFYNLHNPSKISDIEENSIFRRRLAYDELFAQQLALNIARIKNNQYKGMSFSGNGVLKTKLLFNLPFDLTKGQQEVLDEITKDQLSFQRMSRLLQGDVGSGKTVIALISAISVIESGYQVAIMVPTSILANQHYEWIAKITFGIGINVELLTGGTKQKKRSEILHSLKEGSIDLLIGTHALFQEEVRFKNLGYVIIDEQHRFGVKQRFMLSDKGENVDVLMMTATPIPRTLAMSYYGDMDVSKLQEKPVGRKDIDTRIIPLNRISDVILYLQKVIETQEKAYWICPLITESEDADLAAATARYEEFCNIFGKDKIGLIHGKTPLPDREKVMIQFLAGKINILVATTVIEVGVNVPDATIMIIEHAERFGLSQLHQLRGRVGRGEKQSFCFLLYNQYIKGITRQRLRIMKETNDGFFIAEKDLELRGSGEILSTRQSGFADFKVADLFRDRDLLETAHKAAKSLLAKDNTLELTLESQMAKECLCMFKYDEYVQYLGK